MRSMRFVLAASVVTAAIVLAPGCRDATQITVAVRAEGATCKELRGTAITVGSEPAATEENVKTGYVSASTTACTDGSGDIGTLVLTPSDAKRAAIVVVVAYGETTDPTKCPPPDYTGCIVARRSLPFADHEGLRLPIEMSPDCLNVPCDAFSTCRDGQCYVSAVSCSGGTCEEPSVPVDAGAPPPPPPPGVPVAPYCAGTTLHCHAGNVQSDVACEGPAKACCSRGNLAQCGGPATCAGHSIFCCSDADCPSKRCVRPNRVANVPDAGADLDASAVDGGADLDAGADAGSGGADAGSDGGSGGGSDGGSGGGSDGGSGGGSDGGSGSGAVGLGVCE